MWRFHVLIRRGLRTLKEEIKLDKQTVCPHGANVSLYTAVNHRLICQLLKRYNISFLLPLQLRSIVRAAHSNASKYQNLLYLLHLCTPYEV